MKNCPCCGKKFNLWQRAVGEAKEHIQHCTSQEKTKDLTYIASQCRGCPAGCYDKEEHADKK